MKYREKNVENYLQTWQTERRTKRHNKNELIMVITLSPGILARIKDLNNLNR